MHLKKYEDIWNYLKEHGHVALAVPIPLHKKIIKGLINRKHRDLVFRLTAAEENKIYTLAWKIESARIKLFLNGRDCKEPIREYTVDML